MFPVVIGYESVRTLDPRVIVHRFGHLEAQAEQRYYQGPGERRFRISLAGLTNSEKATVVSFFESRKGPWQPFTLNIAEPGGTTATYTVRFADPQLAISKESDFIWSGSIDLIEEPTDTPTFSITTTSNRFPSSGLQSALLSQVQECIPLVKVAPGTGSAFYVADRRVSVGGQLYQPRILDHGGVSQSIDGASDEFYVQLGNADRVLTAIANGYDLWNATVEFSLFHVGTGTKIDLWKGSVIGFDGAAENEFTLYADDGLPLRSDSPKRTILRQDGFVVGEQPVSVGGKKGIANFTATSVTNDTVYGKPLQQIFINNSEKPIGVDCALICGRDESEFYAGLGIVGQGPISGFYEGADLNFRHSLEGQTAHGPGRLGERRSYGGNPTTGSETATDNSPDQGSNYFALDSTSTTWPQNGSPLDGVAFIQIRRADEKGVQPLRPDARQMRAWITGGLGCWKWTSGTRSWQAACTNPFWIALRQWFERKGVQNSDAATQESTFDVAAAEYCAGLADTTVDKIIGEGTEKQFQFTGVIAEAKPTRDWISEIIGNALGYYTTCFGKLKFGIRINASAVESFTTGNVLLDSLKINGRPPDANHMVVAYADEDYAYAQNALELKDEDFGARAGQPKKKNINLVGCSTKSQAARVCSVLFREMLGGTSLSEWTSGRQVEFQTTVLALNTEPGMVCSVTHPDAPGGVLKIRVQRWRLNRDYSITIAGETVTSSMYDLTVGPKPTDVAPDPIPAKNWYDVGVGTNLKYQSLIGNGSFEQGLLGWTVDSLLSAHAELDDTRFWHGTRSLKVTSGATGSATINQPNIAIAGNTSYVFSGFYFRDGLVVDGSLVLAARWVDGAGAPTGTDIVITIPEGTDTDKVQFAVNATSPADAVQVIIYAYQGTHSAGTLNVDGLEFKLFSALAAAAPVTAVTAGLFYSADGSTWGMNSGWTWPGDATTIKGIERRAYFYSDEDGTVEIGYSDLATLSLDTVTNTAQDGGDWPGYETATYVRSAVRTANGDLEKGDWVKSDPVLVDASAVAGTGAVDLTMLASPTITTVGDQFHIEGQFLPGYISAGVSRTVGAAFWWEPGVDGMPEKVGESPYDTTKAGQPSPDNQGSYDIWITKASILTIAADLSGNRTGYLHGLAIEPNAFIPFKPHPTQASAAELALKFTQADLDGAVPLEPPNPPTNVHAVIASVNTAEYEPRPTWTPPDPAGGTTGYDVEFASLYAVGTPAEPDWKAQQYVPGIDSAGWIGPRWRRDDQTVYQYVRVRGRGVDGQVSAWAYSADYATIAKWAQVAAETPNPPNGATLGITVNNAVSLEKYTLVASWTPAVTLGGADRYELEFAFGSTSGFTPSEWINTVAISGGSTTSFTGGPWPKIEIDQYIKFRIRTGNNTGQWSSWVVMTAPGALINKKGVYSVPGAPIIDFIPCMETFSGSRDGRLYGVICYWKDPADISATADYELEIKFWEDYPGTVVASEWAPLGTALSGIGVLGISSKRFGGDWPRQAVSYYTEFRIRGRNASGTQVSAWAYSGSSGGQGRQGLIEVRPNPNPPSPTGLTLSIEVAKLNGAPQYRFRGELAANVSLGTTKRYGWEHAVFSDSSATEGGATQLTPWHEWDSGPTTELVKTSPYYDKPAGTYYGRIRVVPYNEDDSPGTPRYSNIAAIAATSGLDLGAGDPGSLGPGIYIDDAGKIASASHNDLLDGNFDGGGTGWNLYGGATVATGYGEDGTKGARAAVGQAVDQYLVCSPNTYYRFSWRARRNCSVAPIGYIDWFTSGGSIISTSAAVTIPYVNDPNPPYSPIYASYSIVARSPANATRAHVVGAFLYGGGTGYCDIDSATWDGIPNPGSGNTYEPGGGFGSTLKANISNGDFEIWEGGLPKDWFTVGCTQDTGFKYSGSSSAKLTRAGQTVYVLQTRQAIVGQQFQARAQVYTTSSAFVARVRFYDSSGNLISLPGGGTEFAYSIPATAAWQPAVITGLAPTGTVLVQFQVYATAGSGDCWVDAVTVDAVSPQSSVIQYNSSGQSTIVNYGVTADLIADAAINTFKLADGSVASTKIASAAIGFAQIGTGVIVAAHIGSLVVLDAFIKNLSVSQITTGGTLALSGALSITTGLGAAADISQLLATFYGALSCPSLAVGSYGIGSNGVGYFSGLNVGGTGGVTGTYTNVGTITSMTVTGGIITGISYA